MIATAAQEQNRSIPLAVGDLWESTTRKHHGWRIRITKVSQANVSFVVEKAGGNSLRDNGRRQKHHHLLHDVLRRDFVRVRVGEPTTERIRLMQATDVAREGVAPDALNFTGPVLPAEEGIPARSVGHQICTECGILKPIDDFDHFTGLARKSHPEGRLKICHPCIVQKRADAVRAAHAARGGKQKRTLAKEAAAAAEAARVAKEQEMIDRELAAIEEREARAARAAAGEPEPIVFNTKSVAEAEQGVVEQAQQFARDVMAEQANLAPAEAPAAPPVRDAAAAKLTYPPVTQLPRSSLGVALLELAAQADLVEHPPAYREMFSVLDAALRAGTEAGAVFVVPADNYLALQIAIESARRDFEAPPATTEPNETSESNWRKILRDMNVRANGVAP